MFIKTVSYTILTALIVDLLATSGDIHMTWSSPILPKLYSNDPDVNPLGKPITETEESWIGSLINIGAIVGPFPFGYLAGKIGRKYSLLLIAVPHITSYLTSAFAKRIELYYFARVIGGIGVGGGYALLPMYVAEISEDSNRGMLSSTLNLYWTFGNFLPYCIGPYIAISWFNIILACIPATFFILFLLIAPESPYYLITKDRIEEAKKSLLFLRSNSSQEKIDKEIVHIQSGLEAEEDNNFIDIIKTRGNRRGLLISLVLIIGQQISGINAVLFYTQQIFEASGTKDISSDISAIIIGFVIFISSFPTTLLADRLGRKMLLLISAAGMSISHVAFGIFFYLKDADINVKNISWLPIVSLVLYIITFNFGFGPLPWTVSSELFPSGVKSSAASLTSSFAWLTSFFVTRFFNDLNHALGRGGTFWFFGGTCCLSFIFVFFQVFETKGKSFKEIQDILNK